MKMNKLTIKQLRLPTRLTQREFAEKFDIPLRTLQKWEQGKSKPPAYVPEMIYTILQMELKLKTFYPYLECMACDPEGMCSVLNSACNLYNCISGNREVYEIEEDYAALDDQGGEFV